MHRKAFTLIEIMVVVAIIGLIAVMAFPLYGKVRRSAARATVKSDGAQIAAAANRYYMEKSVTIAPVSELLGATSGYVKALSPGNTINVASLLMDSAFTFEIGNPFLTIGGLTFDNEGRVIADPY